MGGDARRRCANFLTWSRAYVHPRMPPWERGRMGDAQFAGGSFDGLSVEQLNQIADAAWRVTREERETRCHQRGRCLTRSAPYGSRDPQARRVHEHCMSAGCLDLLHDLLVRVLAKLQHRDGDAGSAIADLGAYAGRVAARELIELKRAERVAMGFPAKPGRCDGVAARIIARLESDAGAEGPWLVTLFRIMRSYPFSAHHVNGRWPVDGLVIERATYFPGWNGPETVRHDINRVLCVARECAGHEWVFNNLTLPLNSHGVIDELPDDAVEATDVDIDSVVGRLLRADFRRNLASGRSSREALRSAVRAVAGGDEPVPSEGFDEMLAELEWEFAGAGGR